MPLPRFAFLLLVLAASATDRLVLSSEDVSAEQIHNDSGGGPSISSRWLTYACNSKNGDGDGRNRSLLARMLTHPCNSNPNQSTANDLYNANSTNNGNAFLQITMGLITGILALAAILYIIDPETFKELTGAEQMAGRCSCLDKRRIDDEEEDDSQTPYERDCRDQYLTEETANYLDEKRDREVEKPKRKLRSMFYWCCHRTNKEYDESDKYHVPWTGSEDEMKDTRNVNLVLVFFEEMRLRLCWRPTKVYDERDKYDVEGQLGGSGGGGGGGGGGDDDEIKYAASSYESAEAGEAPW